MQFLREVSHSVGAHTESLTAAGRHYSRGSTTEVTATAARTKTRTGMARPPSRIFLENRLAEQEIRLISGLAECARKL